MRQEAALCEAENQQEGTIDPPHLVGIEATGHASEAPDGYRGETPAKCPFDGVFWVTFDGIVHRLS
jgi:hypothetical protein